MATDQQLEKDNTRLREALRTFIDRITAEAKSIETQINYPQTRNTMQRVSESVILLRAAALRSEKALKS